MKIIGNSHAAALRDGLVLLEPEEQRSFEVLGSRGSFEKTVFFKPCSGGVAIVDVDLARRVKKLTGDTVIKPGTEWGFCFGHPGFLLNTRSWEKYRTSDCAVLAEDMKQPVSRGLLQAFVESIFLHVLDFFDCAMRSNISFTVILPPPPIRHGPAISNFSVPLEQVVSIDRMGRQVLTEKGGALGAPVVQAPPESFDADGFLNAQFCAGKRPDGRNDPHHANAAYGKLMLRRIAAVHAGPRQADQD
jgi:hypothetical protein